MKILIVGGAGYVGGYLTDLLHEKHEITVYDNLLYESRFLKEVDFIYGDIRDYEKLGKIINNYDTIVWLAAIVGDGASAVDINLTTAVNYETVKWLVDNYKGKIIFPSTCSVYGINHNLISEEAEPRPLSAYAFTKLQAEQYLIANHNNYLIFRLGTLFGVSDTYCRLRLDLVVNILTKRAVSGETLVVSGKEQWRPLLHVRDVGNAIKFGIDNEISGIYNLSSVNATIADIGESIKKVIPEVKIEFKDISFEDLRNYKVKNDKILSTGWKPSLTLEDGILELKKIFEEQRVTDLSDPVYSNGAFLNKLYKGDKK
jgi:nucleoside-diphosphate-sugar epimerase